VGIFDHFRRHMRNEGEQKEELLIKTSQKVEK
jgi:hypothetical protein